MVRQTIFFVKNVTRALRLPFLTASALPFIFGSIVAKGHFSAVKFLLGLVSVAFTHLSANVINDYADSKSEADWQDRKFFGFFGGSKLIQEGVFTERFYFNLAIFFASLSASAIIALALILKSIFPIAIFLIIIFLSWSYSVKPLQFSYRRIGEIIIFMLFGPVAVMGGYFLQTGIFPDSKSFFLSIPFGFLTTAILYANEIPDFSEDSKAGKFTLVGIFGHKQAYIFYCILVFFVFLSIALNVVLGYLKPAALFSFFLIFVAIKTAGILKRFPENKIKLIESSRLTIAMHAVASLILIVSVIL